MQLLHNRGEVLLENQHRVTLQIELSSNLFFLLFESTQSLIARQKTSRGHSNETSKLAVVSGSLKGREIKVPVRNQ